MGVIAKPNIRDISDRTLGAELEAADNAVATLEALGCSNSRLRQWRAYRQAIVNEFDRRHPIPNEMAALDVSDELSSNA